MQFKCQCIGLACSEKVNLTEEQVKEYADKGWYVIARDCPRGPDPGDALVESHDRYSVYSSALQPTD